MDSEKLKKRRRINGILLLALHSKKIIFLFMWDEELKKLMRACRKLNYLAVMLILWKIIVYLEFCFQVA